MQFSKMGNCYLSSCERAHSAVSWKIEQSGQLSVVELKYASTAIILAWQWTFGRQWFSPTASRSKRSKQFANEREILIQLSFQRATNGLERIHHGNAKNIIVDDSDAIEKIHSVAYRARNGKGWKDDR